MSEGDMFAAMMLSNVLTMPSLSSLAETSAHIRSDLASRSSVGPSFGGSSSSTFAHATDIIRTSGAGRQMSLATGSRQTTLEPTGTAQNETGQHDSWAISAAIAAASHLPCPSGCAPQPPRPQHSEDDQAGSHRPPQHT